MTYHSGFYGFIDKPAITDNSSIVQATIIGWYQNTTCKNERTYWKDGPGRYVASFWQLGLYDSFTTAYMHVARIFWIIDRCVLNKSRLAAGMFKQTLVCRFKTVYSQTNNYQTYMPLTYFNSAKFRNKQLTATD